MKRLAFAALPLALALTAPPAHAHEPAPPTGTPAAVAGQDAALADAYATVDRFTGALKAADFDTVRELLADDVVVLEMGGAEHSREEYLGHHAIGDASFLGGATITPVHRSGRVDGAAAWVASESEITPAAGSDFKPQLSTETMVLRRDGHGWRIVHIHWSSRTKQVAP